MVPPPSSHSRSGTFSPVPAPAPVQSLHTGISHSPHPSQAGPLSAGASPSTSSPTTGTSSLTKIVVAQVYLLLSTIKEDKDRAKWELQVDQLRKLLDDHGMEVFSKYFTRLVAGNAPQIFPGINRPVANPGNYSLLTGEMAKISHDLEQASKIAESIETANEDIFRDFDLSTFMEHFKLDALEKTILALAFKFGSRQDLKTKADAILSTNFPTFVNIISRADYGDHSDLTPSFVATIVDRYIQGHPPNFNSAAKHELSHKVQSRWLQQDQAPPMEVLAALDLIRVLGEKPPNALALYIQRTGADFTRDEETCSTYLQSRPANIQLSEEQVSAALTYTTVSVTHRHNPSVLVAALRRLLPATFRWHDVVAYFDQRDVRVSSAQFLRLYEALLPIAQAQDEQSPSFSIQSLWGGSHWENPETQLSFICAFASLSPNELDASTIPGLQPTFTLNDYAHSPPEVRERAAVAVRHPLVSGLALSAIFQVALHSLHASQSTEAKRLFQEVVVPNLDIFIVSAFGVPKPWPDMAVETLASLFDNFLHRRSEYDDFVLDSLWRKNRDWVTQRLSDAHAAKPTDLTLIFEHVMKHGWLNELVYLPTGLGFDLAALAHAEGQLDLLAEWAPNYADQGPVVAQSLLQFLLIKTSMETESQKSAEGPQTPTTPLRVKTVHAMLQILEDFLPPNPLPELIVVQRACITAYPRLINYGEGVDDVIDANGQGGNGLPPAAVAKMEEHYKKMYSQEVEVKFVVQTLEEYKRSRDPLEQDIFACMIHGLFDEYTHFVDYPLEALATTAVLFGGIISHKLINELPLKIGLGMILESVRDYGLEHPMFKFGLQALVQIFPRFPEWAGFCKQLLQIPALRSTDAYKKAEEVVFEKEDDRVRTQNGTTTPSHTTMEPLTNGAVDGPEPHAAPFAAINVDPAPPDADFEDPVVDIRDRIQFGLNNLTATSLLPTFKEIDEVLENPHLQWFATQLVEERAKMQPNFHGVYLELVKLFQDEGFTSEVLRQTYISVARMLNSESTIQNATDRSHLKSLGGWLGLLTIARDQPIKHKNIAFKQLLIEAHDTKRLVIVVPFVCKVLIQASKSTIFRPPNPWLMDIIHLLIELYHHAELKLNQKFEIEVLCKDLNLDHKSIEPSSELQDRVLVDDVLETLAQDPLDHFDNVSLNGIAGAVPTGLTTSSSPVSIPDIGPLLVIPPTSDMVVNSARLHEIVRLAVTKALQDIIQPVVDRSVTIAAISTQQMIHKDFAIEPDETRLKTAAINMVKATAGSLAQVTSKEPLRANITNYMRGAATELPHPLPEGTIIMCVNSNLDLACNVIEKQAEERAMPEILEMIETELDARRRHRAQRPNEPYVDPGLSRWAMTIPHPYKLSPSMAGLNTEQMAIYDGFARQPIGATQASANHASSSSDATRNIANEVLQDQYSSVPNLATPAETPSLPHLNTQQLPYSHVHAGMANGRAAAAHPLDGRGLMEKVERFLSELKQRTTTSTDEEHFGDLPRSHPVLEVVDAFTQLIINTSQNSEEFTFYAVEKICQHLFSGVDNTLFLESLVHILELLLKITANSGTALHDRVQTTFYQQSPQNILNISLITALLPTEFFDLQSIDRMMAKMLAQREEGYLEFFEKLLDLTLFCERPVALFSDFVASLGAAWDWINDDPSLDLGQRLKSKLIRSGVTKPQSQLIQDNTGRLDQFDYVFEEWTRLYTNPNTPQKTLTGFVRQIRSKSIVSTKDDCLIFVRRAIDVAVNFYEQGMSTGANSTEGFAAVDGLANLIGAFAKDCGAEHEDDFKAGLLPILEAVISLVALVLNHHYVTRGEQFNQRVFVRLFSMIMHNAEAVFVESPEPDVCRQEFSLYLAETFLQIGPNRFDGFSFGWLSLLGHRLFIPILLSYETKLGWIPYTKLLKTGLRYVSEHMKSIDLSDLIKEYYRSMVKLMVMITHDYSEYVSANSSQLCLSISPHCTQLRNIVLNSGPRSEAEEPAPPHPHGDEALSFAYLKDTGMLEILEHVVLSPPSEDAIAHLTHAINKNDPNETTFGRVPVAVDMRLIDGIVTFMGNYAIARSRQDMPLFVPGAPDVAALSLLVHELQPQPRYFLLSNIFDRLRQYGPFTDYFGQVIFEIFGQDQDLNDPEEVDIRQQIVRIMLERVAGFWPQPWGLIMVIMELVTKEKYHFFEQPFIKADRDIAEQFMAIARQHAQ
ncbi:Not1-domain-containing protein [Hypoxylon sp. NC1633]|nr:Not1-domain-containing protein [Hypoxylon sp. NC1633]